MIFEELDISGAYSIQLDKKNDERGFFARAFCKNEFEEKGLDHAFVQMNTSFTQLQGTVRGMHFQYKPADETKMVRCFSGVVYDVILDLRPNSSSFLKWVSIELSASNRTLVYIPNGCAHGFQTLTDNVELLYWHSCPFSPTLQGGVNVNDPSLDIRWPLSITQMSERDQLLPLIHEIQPTLS